MAPFRIYPVLRVLLPAALLLFVTGCYEVAEAGDVTTVRFSRGVRLLLILIPAAAAFLALGLMLVPAARFGAKVVLGLVAFVSLTVLPGIYLDTVTVTPTRVEQRTGFWWSRTVKGFNYGDVESVTLAQQPVRRGGLEGVWLIRRRDGTTAEIDPGDLWDNNTPAIVEKLRGFGVRFR